jgi:hypothetical protein
MKFYKVKNIKLSKISKKTVIKGADQEKEHMLLRSFWPWSISGQDLKMYQQLKVDNVFCQVITNKIFS